MLKNGVQTVYRAPVGIENNNKKNNSVSDYQTFGLLNLRTIGPSDYRAFGLSDYRAVTSDYRIFEPSPFSVEFVLLDLFYGFLCSVLQSVLSFFFWVIVLSVHLRFTDSDFPFESSSNSSKRDILNDCFSELTLILCNKSDTIIKSELGLAMKQEPLTHKFKKIEKDDSLQTDTTQRLLKKIQKNEQKFAHNTNYKKNCQLDHLLQNDDLFHIDHPLYLIFSDS